MTNANARTATGGLTPRQLELRRGGVGASEIAVLCGLSRWSSPAAIWESKVRGEGLEPTYAMRLGLAIEDPIAVVWADMNDRYLVRVDTLQHPTMPYALATPDRGVYVSPRTQAPGELAQNIGDAERALQVKSTNWRMRRFWGEDGTDQIPSDFLCGAHWEGAVSGLERVTFAVDFDKTALHTFEVVVRLSAFEAMYEIAERFMVDNVEAQVPPDPDDTERYGEFLLREFPKAINRAAPPRVMVPEHEPEVYAAVELFARLEAATARMKKLRQKARNQITRAIGHGTGISGTWGKITWLQNKDSTLTDWKAYAHSLATMAALVIETMPKGEQRDQMVTLLKTLQGQHQKTKKGNRTLRKTFEGRLKFDLDVLEIRLDKLALGLAEITEDEDSEAQYEPPKEGNPDNE